MSGGRVRAALRAELPRRHPGLLRSRPVRAGALLRVRAGARRGPLRPGVPGGRCGLHTALRHAVTPQ
ncbi:Putative diacylglycerol O-acyltransferase [Frankliniella fusca]|uniref:Diacylglycerol O-acyltransferase n=1 Tax=Frankliniella fusca TaxID=407009 RepID=A0AAE1HIX6_9NEOP|nr:Putative diacylglycerol O-acyltransferase [Frankliniella fusca]